MNRRTLLALLAGAALPLPARTQTGGRRYRIAFFYYGSRDSALKAGRYQAFVSELASLGYVEGKNLLVDAHYADGEVDRLGPAAADMVNHGHFRPCGRGFVESLARPGGNITGAAGLASDLLAKHLDLLEQCVPGLKRVAVLTKSDNPSHAKFAAVIDAAARKNSIRVIGEAVHTARDIEASFASMASQGAQALVILAETFFLQQAGQIAALARRQRMPSIYFTQEYPEAGGMMSYGPDLIENFRRAAHFADKIFKGAKPGDLPIEQPTKLELVINLRTAREIGVSGSCANY